MAVTDPPSDPAKEAAPIVYPQDSSRQVATPAHRLRRELLKGALGAVAAGILAYFGWTKYLFPPQGRTQSVKIGGVKIGGVGAFPASGVPQLVPAQGDAAYFVENLGGGQFRVLSAKCTHQGCAVAWTPGENAFVCPCHNGHFDRAGKNISGPPSRPLSLIPSHVQDGALYAEA